MPPTLSQALPILMRLAQSEDAARDAHAVGGWVRDTLLGRAMRELDVSAPDAPALADRAAEVLGSHVVPLGGRHPLFRVPLQDGHLDITPRHGTLEDDLGRRDFTVNALAVALSALNDLGGLSERGNVGAEETRLPVVDPHGGLADLEARMLRAVAPTALEDDPVRALRAARLSAELDFEVDAATLEGIPAVLKGVRRAAPERVCAELLRLFAADRATRGVRVLEASGLLEVCFSELREGYGMEQRPWHAYTVYRHQVVAFERVDLLLAPGPPEDPAPLPVGDEGVVWHEFWRGVDWPSTRWGELRELLDAHRAAIRLATLLHDVGKPRTLEVQPDGRTRFFGHSEVGARMVEERLREWRFPTAFIDRVTLLIEQHLRPGQVMSPGELPTNRALHRLHEALGDATPDVCMLFLADSLSTEPVSVGERWPAYVRHVHRIIDWRPPAEAEEVRRLVDGHVVMRHLGLEPGPSVGRVMRALNEAVASGEVTTEAEALRLAEHLARDEAPDD